MRQRLAGWAALAARCCFAAVIILIPLRYYVLIRERPMPPVYSSYRDFRLFAADEALALVFLLWLISWLLRPRRITPGPRHIWIPLCGLTLTAWMSVRGSYDPALSTYHAIRLTTLFWLYLFVVNEIPAPGWIVIPVGVQLASEAVVAMAQFLAQHSVGLARLGEPYLDAAAPGGSVVVTEGLRLMRAYGLTDHPNILGGCLAFGLVLLLPHALHATRARAAWVVFLPATAALLATFSRSAWLGLACGAGVLLSIEVFRRRWETVRGAMWLGLASTLVAGAFLLAYPASYGVRLNAGHSFAGASPERQSIGARVILLKLATPMLLDHPLTGVGIGASPTAMQSYYPNVSLTYEPPHWALFDAALETGLPGGASYLALMVFPVMVFLRRRQTLGPMAGTALALLVSIAVVGMFDYYPWLLNPGRLWQWLGWGLWGLATAGPPRASEAGDG